MGKISISGTGCSLADNIYSAIDFTSDEFRPLLSRKPGDGGLEPGKLVFTEEFEAFTGNSFHKTVNNITKGNPPDAFNIGGPCIVALIHAAQILVNHNADIRFFGARGNDEIGKKIIEKLKLLPVNIDGYRIKDGHSPFTDVFSDPSFNHGMGERIFVNNIGAAWNFAPSDLSEEFFDAQIHVFGGTALVPKIHDQLGSLLKKSRKKGAFTVVNTVFDFRNEKKNPNKPWPLGESDDTYAYVDILITDHAEALRLSGQKDISEAMEFFIKKGTSTVIITSGESDILLYSNGRVFMKTQPFRLPISKAISSKLKNQKTKGDTTGCGDNFAGGIIASLADQLSEKPIGNLDLKEACSWGIVSGGFACFYMGGTYYEQRMGEKRNAILPYLKEYINQIDL